MPARPIHDETKVLVNHGLLGIVCLLLSLSQQAGLNCPLQVASLSQWLDRCREPASGSPTASVVRSTQFDLARAGPLTSLVLEDAWTEGNIGPPGQETRRPPKPIGICQVAGQSRQLKTNEPPCLRKFLDSADRI